MTSSQYTILDQVKAFVLENHSISSPEQREAELSMHNTLKAKDRTFLATLADDLHLTLSWDEYDEEGQNLVVLRFPVALELPTDEQDSWSGSQDKVDATAALDCIWRKYDGAEILVETVDGISGLQEELILKQKMDDWKRAYYSV